MSINLIKDLTFSVEENSIAPIFYQDKNSLC